MKTQKGRSMIEMLGVLAIIGVLSVGGLVGYQKAMHKHTVDEFIYGLQQTWTEALSRPKVKAPSGDYYIDQMVLCNTVFDHPWLNDLSNAENCFCVKDYGCYANFNTSTLAYKSYAKDLCERFGEEDVEDCMMGAEVNLHIQLCSDGKEFWSGGNAC